MNPPTNAGTRTLAFAQSALRMVRRDWRSAELRLLALALVIAVAAVSSVGFFVDRVRQGLQRDAAQYLGGDAVLESDHPLAAALLATPGATSLRSVRTASFPSMVVAPAANALVAVKAVTELYPLHGSVQLEDAAGPRSAVGIPAPGTVWVDPALLPALHLSQGDTLQLGNAQLRIAARIALEPDRSIQTFAFAPRVLMNAADLPATGLIQPASRVTYRWLLAGEHAQVHKLVAALKPQLARGQRLETLDDGRPEMQNTLGRADSYLGLVALVTVLIAAVAVSTAARRFTAQRLDACALMRCFGLSQGSIVRLFATEFLLVALLASVVGVVLGFLLHSLLLHLLAGLLQQKLPLPGVYPALQGLACGLILLLGFGLPPLEQLRRVSPIRVLRRDLGAPQPRRLLGMAAALLGFALLLAWTAGDIKLGAIVGLGFAACVGLFVLAAWGLLRGLRRLRSSQPSMGVVWRFALAALQRRPGASITQLVSLAVALMALLLLALVRTDLVDQWRGQAPPDAPNRFIINIQPEQQAPVSAALLAAGIQGAQDTPARLEPMVRGRLVQIDGRNVGPEAYADERTRSLIDREFNLSYRSDPPDHNRIVQGHWFRADAAELSIEEGIAKRLDIHLGQRLAFDVAGQTVEATVGSVRKLSWDSMRVNFFVILPPALLRDAPQSFITALHVQPAQADALAALVRQYPNLTVINTDQVLGQVRRVLDQVIGAAQFLFAFALSAGVLVLYTALVSSQDERQREAALLRALGATRAQLGRAQAIEMVLVGVCAGLLAATGASAIAWALAHFAFEFDFTVPGWVFLAGVAGGVAAALAGSWTGMRRILEAPPLLSLREAG